MAASGQDFSGRTHRTGSDSAPVSRRVEGVADVPEARPAVSPAPRTADSVLAGKRLTPAAVRSLQGAYGNQFVQRLVRQQLPQHAPTSSTLVQRNAAEWGDWATRQGVPDHTFADGAGGFVVIDSALDATDAFLKSLGADELKKLLAASKALQAAGFDLNTVPDTGPDKLKTFIAAKQTSEGGRMRFRGTIGPTPGGTSVLETFAAGPLATAFGGTDKVPKFLQLNTMSVGDRARLYDLPNASQSDAMPAALKWAVAQNCKSVGEFVNYVEYYKASRDIIDQEATAGALKKFETVKGSVPKPPDDDPGVIAAAKELAKTATLSKLRGLVGKYIGKLGKANLTVEDQKTLAETTFTVTGFSGKIDGFTVGMTKDAFLAVFDAKAQTIAAQEAVYSAQLEPAKAQLQVKPLDELKARLKLEALAELEQTLPARFTGEQQKASAAGFVGGGPVIDNFAAKNKDEQLQAIVTKAGAGIVPFRSADAAAYHAVKHYNDLANTEDKAAAATPEARLTAYLNSAWKTLKQPDSSRAEQQQLYGGLSYFFVRTVPAAPGVAGKAQDMRAIAAVGPDGAVNITTYFRK